VYQAYGYTWHILVHRRICHWNHVQRFLKLCLFIIVSKTIDAKLALNKHFGQKLESLAYVALKLQLGIIDCMSSLDVVL
jgi:hypothetical protein